MRLRAPRARSLAPATSGRWLPLAYRQGGRPRLRDHHGHRKGDSNPPPPPPRGDRSFRLNSITLAVSETASRRWWCIEDLFPGHEQLLAR